jgi:hypothetical protein
MASGGNNWRSGGVRLGSLCSREYGDPLSPLSMSARTNPRRPWRRYKHYRREPFAGDDGRIQDDRGESFSDRGNPGRRLVSMSSRISPCFAKPDRAGTPFLGATYNRESSFAHVDQCSCKYPARQRKIAVSASFPFFGLCFSDSQRRKVW